MSDPAQLSRADTKLVADTEGCGTPAGISAGSLVVLVEGARAISSAHQLPAPTGFVGRARECEALLAAVRAYGSRSAALVAICGLAGLGKTELALHLAYDLRDDYPDAQLFINLHGLELGAPYSASDGLRDTIRTFDPSALLPDDPAALAALYRQHLSGKRVLVLLDNAPDDATARLFLPPAGSALLVTARTRLSPADQTLIVDLARLHRDDSRALLLGLAPHLADDPSLNRLLDYCDDLPLALQIAGATLGDNQALALANYLIRLSSESGRLQALKCETPGICATVYVAAALLGAANPTLARRWRMLGVCTAPFEAATAASIWAEEDHDAAADALNHLVRRALLSYDAATGRYHLHEFPYEIARTCCPAEEALTAHLRHAAHYRAIVRHAERLYAAGSADAAGASALFDASLPHIRAAQTWAASTPTPQAARLAIDLALQASTIMSDRLSPAELIAWYTAVVDAAGLLRSRYEQMDALVRLGQAYIRQDNAHQARACFDQSLALTRELGDRNGEGLALAGLGDAAVLLGDLRRAIMCYEQWLAVARALGDRQCESRVLVGLGSTHKELGDARAAIRRYAEGLPILRQLGDRHTEGMVLEHLGDVYVMLGDPRRADECYRQSLAIFQELDDQEDIATVCWSMGEILARQGEYARAADLMYILVAHERDTDHPDAAHHAAILAQIRLRMNAGGSK